jgi:hypothetical protein
MLQTSIAVIVSAQRGNATDPTREAIALPRASGIPARHVHDAPGVPIDRFWNWADSFYFRRRIAKVSVTARHRALFVDGVREAIPYSINALGWRPHGRFPDISSCGEFAGIGGASSCIMPQYGQRASGIH